MRHECDTLRRMRTGHWLLEYETEDLVHLFEEMGIKTGLDLEKLLDCARLAEPMAGIPLPDYLLRAGKASQIAGIPQHPKRQKILD